MRCPFCSPDSVLFENEYAFVKEDAYPVSRGHLLIIPKRHVETCFSLTEAELSGVLSLLGQAKIYLDEKYAPDGYTVGMNCGTAAGQTVPHAHLHLIPRYHGDVADPRGGIRGVIPAKKEYPQLNL